jgi:penicillin-insensitive murein endopeptidase
MTLIIKFHMVILLVFIFITPSHSSDLKDSESIGFYTADCIRNSQKLNETGFGYQVIRLTRNRFYGHPDLIEFIYYLGEKSRTSLNSTLLIADLSEQTGGPLPTDHNSHQTGLDADILYLNHNNEDNMLSVLESEEIEPVSVLNTDKTKINEEMWSDNNSHLLKIAAIHKKVERIFVNPILKKELCKNHKDEKWLNKIRPWYGHDGHFHVRLKCPENSTLCEKQEPVDIEDGCGEDLEQWLTGTIKSDKTKPQKKRHIPKECKNILGN